MGNKEREEKKEGNEVAKRTNEVREKSEGSVLCVLA